MRDLFCFFRGDAAEVSDGFLRFRGSGENLVEGDVSTAIRVNFIEPELFRSNITT